MSFNLTFLGEEERNIFAQKTGLSLADSNTIEINDSLFVYSMRYEGAEVEYVNDGAIKLLVPNFKLSSLTDDFIAIDTTDDYTIIETGDPVAVYNACDGDVDCVDAPIKLMSELTGSVVTEPNDWARKRLSNRFRPFQEFNTFDIVTTNKPVIFVVDSGINDHPELSNVNVTNFGKLEYCSDFADNLGHGTAVTSCIAGNNIGITHYVDVFNYKIFDGSDKPTILQLGEVLDNIKAYKVENSSKNVTVNVSWTATYSPYLRNKFLELIDAGCVIVCAAGNNADDVSNYIPAGMPEVITVGAIDEDDIIAGFNATSIADASITSPYGQSLDIFAPGVDVDVAFDGGYKKSSGTSLSAGFTSGAVSVWQSISPNPVSNSEVLALLVTGSLKGAILFNREAFSSNQNRIVQLINGDSIPPLDHYLGAFLSADAEPIIASSSSFGFNSATVIVTDSTEYSLEWIDPAQEDLYSQFVSLDPTSGDLTITRPTNVNDEDLVRISFKINKTTNFSSEKSSPIFFFATNAESGPELVLEQLNESDYEFISVTNSGAQMAAKP